MNTNFYNNRFTYITPDPIGYDIPLAFDKYHGRAASIVNTIKTYELNNDQFYSGHLFVSSKAKLWELFSEDFTFDDLLNIKLTRNNIVVKKVHHTGVDSECTIDSNVILCSSWVLPIIGYANRTSTSLYGNLMRHRIRIFDFERLDKIYTAL